jgi:hypothetical protein
MKIIKFILGTIISIIAVAIATKIAAVILTLLGIAFFLVVLVVKVAFIVAAVAFGFWLVSKIFSKRETESY